MDRPFPFRQWRRAIDEQMLALEMIVGKIDKRLGSIEQHLVGFHAAIGQVREEVAQVRLVPY